jgi:hypothetical protein
MCRPSPSVPISWNSELLSSRIRWCGWRSKSTVTQCREGTHAALRIHNRCPTWGRRQQDGWSTGRPLVVEFPHSPPASHEGGGQHDDGPGNEPDMNHEIEWSEWSRVVPDVSLDL